MSIADQAKDRASPLCQFLDANLPDRAGVTDAWASSLAAAPWTGRDLAEGWDHLGCALELRIGLDLAASPAPRHYLSYLPAAEYQALLTAAGFRQEPVGEMPDGDTTDPALGNWVRPPQQHDPGQDTQRDALEICLDLAMVRNLAYKWGDSPPVGDPPSWFTTVTAKHRLSANTALVDALAHAWTGYLRHGRAALRALGDSALVDVELAGGYGVADLVIGRSLVDVKVTAEPVSRLDQWLCQLLGYVLLDRDDALRLDTIAIYAGCQATLLTCRISDLLRAASRNRTPNLSALRAGFHAEIRQDLDRFTSWKQQHAH